MKSEKLHSISSEKILLITTWEEFLKSEEEKPGKISAIWTCVEKRITSYVISDKGCIKLVRTYWWNGEIEWAVKARIGRDLET